MRKKNKAAANIVSIKTDFIKQAALTLKQADIKLDDSKLTSIAITEENKDLLEFLQDNFPLTNAQKNKINSIFLNREKLVEFTADNPSSFYRALSVMNGSEEPVLELKINNKWYPVMATISKFKSYSGGWLVDLNAYGAIGALNYAKRVLLGDWTFEDNAGTKTKKSINDVLKSQSLRLTTPEAILATKKSASRLTEFNTHENKVFDATGIGLHYNESWGFWSDINIGWKDAPASVIIEPNLENRYAGREREEGWKLPFVRVFSLKHKGYVYADVDDLVPHIFHRDGINKIILPGKMMTAITSIFNAKQDNIFGDLFHGRHGGIVVLANGPSGVGKTLTAEVFAEYQERPLYTMEMGEIGTNLASVEANLNKIFARAKKWNAVLLFDEADIFLSERVASDLERSAIVGIFLRLLDYYEGTFFLTTNRGEGIDKAFKSRVTLYLDYPELSNEIRLKIWQSMLKAANLSPVVTNVSWEEVVAVRLNGRQIRNQVRLLKLMYPDGVVDTAEVLASLDFTAK